VLIILLLTLILLILFKDPEPPVIDYVELEDETLETLNVSSTVRLYDDTDVVQYSND